MCDGMCVTETQVNASDTVKAVGSSHKDAPDVSLPAHASSDPTSQKSQVSEPTPHQVWPLLYQKVK